jgi:hypothetical protein
MSCQSHYLGLQTRCVPVRSQPSWYDWIRMRTSPLTWLLLENEAEALALSTPNSATNPNSKPLHRERLEEPALS